MHARTLVPHAIYQEVSRIERIWHKNIMALRVPGYVVMSSKVLTPVSILGPVTSPEYQYNELVRYFW